MQKDQLIQAFWRISWSLRQRIAKIILTSFFCGMVLYAANLLWVEPKYEATVSMYIYSNAQISNEITVSELNAAQALVDTYAVILKSDTVMDEVIDNLDLDIDASELQEKVSAHAVNDTAILEVTVCDADPKIAQIIANEVASVLPDTLIRVIKASAVEIVDYAKLPEEPTRPNGVILVVGGVVAGFFLSCGIILLYDYFNTKIKNEEEINTYFKLPVLGCIPKIKEN